MKSRVLVFGVVIFFAVGLLLMPMYAQKSGQINPPGGGKGAGKGTGPAVGGNGSRTDPHNGPTPVYIRTSSFAVSPPLKSLPKVAAKSRGGNQDSPEREAAENGEEVNGTNLRAIRNISPTAVRTPDAALQNQPNVPNAIPGPSLTFEGQAVVAPQVAPPDTNGDIGPNHYVELVNDSNGTLVRIFNPVTGASIAGPFTLGSLFGGFPQANGGGDPVVLYDQMADRWLLSEFAFTSTSSGNYHMSIAISKTADPTGAYFLYDFTVPTQNFPDYPKFGVWPDGYYMTSNQFFLGGAFNGAGAYAFERNKMLIGDPTASIIYFDLNLTAFPEGLGGMLPTDFDGLIPPPAGAPNVFMYFTAGEFGDPADGIRAYNFHADFATPGNSTFLERSESSLASPIPVAAFDPITPTGRTDIDQRPPGEKVDSIGDRLMHRLQYRNFGSSERWTVNHTVDASGDPSAAVYRAGVRFYELTRTTGNANPISVLNQATFAPLGAGNEPLHRWMGSSALDNSGDIAVGYSVSSTTREPELRWAGRLFNDPANMLAQGEAVVFDATGVQTSNTFNRWGDYSAMTVDPDDDCTFFYAQEYYATDSAFNWHTRIGKFSFPSCVAPQQGMAMGQITICGGGPLADALVTFTGGPSNGYSVATDSSGNFSRKLSPGTYTATITKATFGTVVVPNVVVTNAGTVMINQCLQGAATLMAAGSSLVAESCTPTNGAIDPGETVTVSLCLKNTGGAATTALMGTLQASGGVTAIQPPNPQNYGAIPADGTTIVCRNFTFTAAGTCGGTITATLDLSDGGNPLGSVMYTFTLGAQAVVLSENFDGVTAPALPAGWTTSFINGAANCTPTGTCALGSNWTTATTNTPPSAPNAAFHNDVTCVTDNFLVTPPLNIVSNSTLTFTQARNIESTFDGTVLEVSTNGGSSWTDVITNGGSFVSNGYNGTISANFLSPIAGRMAWTGLSGGSTAAPAYITTVVNLGPNVNGQTINLRWRLATDCSVAASGLNGMWIDNVSLTGGFVCCTNGATCTLTCPANITVSNDPGQCGAVVNYPAPTTTGDCGTVTCSPPSGSFFPVGTTTVTCVASSGGGMAPSPNGGTTCPPTTITGSLGSGSNDWPSVSGTQTGRLNRNGIASSCASPKTCLIFDTTPGRAYDAYTFHNNSGATACVSVTLNVLEQTNSNYQVDAYLGSFDPANICTNYLADPGLSSGIPPSPVSMAFNVPDGMDFILDVHTTNPGEIGGAYELTFADTSFCVPSGGGGGGTGECSFTVTVTDNEAPVITCPANIIAVAANPSDACVPVNFNVTATDNCPGVTVQCVNAANPSQIITSGFCFPVASGCTTVLCTATDASGNTSTCTFTVCTFDVIVQDDSDPLRELLFNSATGAYIFCCDGTEVCGTGTLKKKGCLYSLNHTAPSWRLTATVDACTHKGTASLQFTSGHDACSIQDRDTRNDFITCTGTGINCPFSGGGGSKSGGSTK